MRGRVTGEDASGALDRSVGRNELVVEFLARSPRSVRRRVSCRASSSALRRASAFASVARAYVRAVRERERDARVVKVCKDVKFGLCVGYIAKFDFRA